MKTTMKWAAWIVGALIVIGLFSESDKLTQWGLAILVGLGWALHAMSKTLDSHHRQQMDAIRRLEEKMDASRSRLTPDFGDSDLPIGR